jgi:hypothetical protein
MLQIRLTLAMKTSDFMKPHVIVCVIEFRSVEREDVRRNGQGPNHEFCQTKGQAFEKARIQHALIDGTKGEKLQD